ncbi:uncharacterized protein PG986_013837 [Apiospora aurea]|uniref:Uncharacterized protein n=1 Tax=Apiospora aurea TaxID=335848 RepID=A0ABR1PXR8_9PEZI
MAAGRSSALLNQVDKFLFSPLDRAMCLSKEHCNSNPRGRKCSKCTCAHSVGILLQADCAVTTPSDWILEKSSRRAIRIYAHQMADRHSRLKQFALQYRSILDAEGFRIGTNELLDARADDLVVTLTKHDIIIPNALRPIRMDRPMSMESQYVLQKSDGISFPDSIYGRLSTPWQAELFWRAGFQNLAHALERVQDYAPPRPSYLYWLVEHGATPQFPVLTTSGNRKTRLGLDPGVILRVVRAIGSWFAVERKSMREMEAARALNARFLHLEWADRCICKCSTDACTLYAHQLKALFKFVYDKSGEETCTIVVRYFGRGFSAVPDGFDKATIRYLTFRALGATHTCCSRRGGPLDAEAAEDVKEEERVVLEVHERLVSDFEREFSATVETLPLNIGQFESFWRGYWRPRIEEEVAGLERDDLPQDVKRGAEEVGVIWDVPKPAPSRKPPVNKRTWEYWFAELDKIVPPENHEIGEIRSTW